MTLPKNATLLGPVWRGHVHTGAVAVFFDSPTAVKCSYSMERLQPVMAYKLQPEIGPGKACES